MTKDKSAGFGTLAVHAGQSPDPSTGAVMTPVYFTSTYAQHAPGDHQGYAYSRTHNPTRTALQDNIAALEKGTKGIAFASGLAAVDAIVRLLKPGDELVSSNDLYGGTYRLFTKLFAHYGIVFKFIDLSNTANLEEVLSEKTKLVWIETPSNPLLQIIDVKAIAAFKLKYAFELVVDNTFATTYLQKPLDLGADIVMHSATKYLGGHSDVVLGLIVVNKESLAERLFFIQNAAGAIPGPMDCFLVLRGIKTLHLRMRQHCENAKQIAHYLQSHPKVEKVYWPGLSSHRGHGIAAEQMKDFGGMISFSIKGNKESQARSFLSKLNLFTLAESLGGVESLCGHPASMTHASIPREERIKAGLSDSLIRLSVGIEDADDLVEDIDQALSKI